MEATPAQIAQYERAKARIEGPLGAKVKQLITIGDFGDDVDAWGSDYGFDFQVVSDDTEAKIKKILGAYNRLARVIAKVDIGKYGVRFEAGDFDVMAPVGYPGDELAMDKWVALDGIPIIIVVGALVVGAIWGTSEIVGSVTSKQEKEIELKLRKIDAQMIKNPDPQIRTSWQVLKKQNEPKLKAAGIFDKIFGGGASTSLFIVGGALIALSLIWSRSKK